MPIQCFEEEGMVNHPAIAASQHTPHAGKEVEHTAADFHYRLSVATNIWNEDRKEGKEGKRHFKVRMGI